VTPKAQGHFFPNTTEKERKRSGAEIKKKKLNARDAEKENPSH